jgi:hypothetical protein
MGIKRGLESYPRQENSVIYICNGDTGPVAEMFRPSYEKVGPPKVMLMFYKS